MHGIDHLRGSMNGDEKNEEIIFKVRCSVCNKILFEASEDASGLIIKKCDGCKRMRRVRLPLHSGAKRNTIPEIVAKAA